MYRLVFIVFLFHCFFYSIDYTLAGPTSGRDEYIAGKYSYNVCPNSDIFFRPSKGKRFSLNIINKVNWFQAMYLCHSMNMRFASINNQQEYDQLVETIREANLGDVTFWISANDLGIQGKYLWASTGRPMTFTHWLPGEPNHADRDGLVEHCVEMAKIHNFRMNDDPCVWGKFYVCEY